MLEKLKNLDYVSLKECETLDKISILYVDVESQVFQKHVTTGIFEIDKLDNLPEAIETFFIEKIKEILKPEQIISIDSKLIEKIDDIVYITIDKFIDELKEINIKFHNDKKFIIISKKLNDKKLCDKYIDNYSIIVSEYLKENEIIFGYKTKWDQPGIILITNDEGIKDKNNVRLTVIDIGFFPEKAYYMIKIM